MHRLVPLLFLSSAVIACGVGVVEEDVEQGEQNLTDGELQLAKIREAVKEVDEERVVFEATVKAPTKSAGTGATAGGAFRGRKPSLYGIDWFQKWGGGRSADHDWETGSENGKRCMWASVARFEAIINEAPPELETFLSAYTKWDGSFYNWNDDYSGKSADGAPAFGDAKGARIWAWRTTLSKWISATAKDGSCYLPTRKMLVDYLAACKTHVAENDGEMQGCEAVAE